MARAGLVALLPAERFQLVAEAGSCRELLPVLGGLRSELIVVELVRDEVASFGELRSLALEALLLVLVSSEDLVGDAVRAGADGILLNSADGGEIIAAVDRLLAGQAVLDPALAIHALRADAAILSAPEPLTERELEILQLISRGDTNPQIAARLFLAVGTVKVHVQHIIAKLGASDRTDAAVRAMTHGLLAEDPAAERHMPAGR
jgi:DNA-binding NarL/FixJ family response regulator